MGDLQSNFLHLHLHLAAPDYITHNLGYFTVAKVACIFSQSNTILAKTSIL